MILTNVKMAFEMLKHSKVRSLLTMLGVIIGVAAVISIVSLGLGLKHQINSQINSLGNNLVTILPGNTIQRDAQGNISGFNLSGATTSTLSQKDITTVQSNQYVDQAVGTMSLAGSVQVNRTTVDGIDIVGVSTGYLNVSGQKLSYGQSLDSVENPKTVILGNKLATRLFGDDSSAISKSVILHKTRFTVVGVLAKKPTETGGLQQNKSNAAIINLAQVKKLNNNNVQIQQIEFRVNEGASVNNVTRDVKKAILTNHKGEQDFSIIKQDELLSATDNVFKLLTTFIGAIAGISLLVGGIGIMNVMIASVTERTREIGIRKSIGATNGQILGQFLTEAAVLSLVGGIIGILVALAITYGLKNQTTITPVFTWQTIALAVGVSVVIGIVFGVAPAINAARKDPIESLRHE